MDIRKCVRLARVVCVSVLPLFLLVLNIGCAGRSASLQEKQVARMTEMATKQQEEKIQKEQARPDHLELARELMRKGLYKVALVQLEKARGEQAGREVFELMGRCQLELRDAEHAVQSFRRALAMDSGYAPAHNGLGLALDLSGARESAWKSYGKAIELNPAIPDFHNNLGYSKLVAGRYGEAERHLRDALALKPDLKTAANNLALCQALQGRYDQSFELLKRNGSDAAAANNIGVFHELNGEKESAVHYYRTALGMDAGLKTAAENIGNREIPAGNRGKDPAVIVSEMTMEEPR